MNEKIFCITSPGQRTYYQATLVAKEFLDKDNNLVNSMGKIPDGEVTEISTSSITRKNFENGQLHGKLEIINLADNSVTFSEEYQNGQLVHVTEPHISTVSTPVQEKKNAPLYPGTILKTTKDVRAFYVNGKQVAEETVSANGATLELLGTIPDGEVKEFTESGKLKTEATYKDNKLNGTLIRYTEEGNLLSKETYENGILKGPAEYNSYLKNNVLHTQCNYKNAVLEGESTITQQDGIVRDTNHYVKGKPHGTHTTFYADGTTEMVENFVDGKLQGERKLFFPTGQLWYQENYMGGRLDGERKEFFTSGKLRLSEWYSEGLLDGQRNLYDEQGSVIASEEFHWGNIVHNTEYRSL